MPWIRLGDCHRCGQCCYLKNLLKATIHANTSVSCDEGVHCKHLSFEDDGTATCKIFATKKRPLACSMHPSSPASLIEGCGYFFVWVE